MKKGLLPIGIIGIIIVIAVLIAGLSSILPSKIVIQSKGTLSLENHIALAAQIGGSFGNGEPLPQQIAPILGRGGLPIVSVSSADPPSDSAAFPDDDPVRQGVLLDNERIEHVRVKIEQPKVSDNVSVPKVPDNVTTPKVSDNVSVPKVSDNVTAPKVSDNVSVPKVPDNVTEQVQDTLVIALGYGAIHIYSLSPLQFTTQFNGLDAGKVSGAWWQ
jgi:hypothetical protein